MKMEQHYPNLIIGYHGCAKSLGLDVINGTKDLEPSKNKYDWLGSGIYFWENDYDRALEFATEYKKDDPFVVGAVLYLGNCLDLTQRKSSEIIKTSYDSLIEDSIKISITNRAGRQGGINGDLLLRDLDCAVIQAIHDFHEKNGIKPYDSIRAAFWEGRDLYNTAGFKEKNHIQLCVRNPKCVLGYFLPRVSKR